MFVSIPFSDFGADGKDWLLAMYEMYTDDSGTHAGHPLAIAACYISTKRGWDQFVHEYDSIRVSEGFDDFHMVDFAAKPEYQVEPYCHWDGEKKKRVYRRIVKALNNNKRTGLGVGIPKDVFDKEVPKLPEPLKRKCGKNHYAFAVRILMTMVQRWRLESGITLPMKYFFDRMGKGKGEIMSIWEDIEDHEWDDALRKIGMEPKGYGFEDRKEFQPLQMADILAWQMNWHLRNVILAGKDDKEDCHENFFILRNNQELRLGFLTEANFKQTILWEIEAMKRKGVLASDYEANAKNEAPQ